MSLLIEGIDFPKKHYVEGYYIDSDGRVLDIGRRHVIGKASRFERKTGKWIKVGEEQGAFNITYTIHKCSECGWTHSLCIPSNYCPNCGTRMEGDEE